MLVCNTKIYTNKKTELPDSCNMLSEPHVSVAECHTLCPEISLQFQKHTYQARQTARWQRDTSLTGFPDQTLVLVCMTNCVDDLDLEKKRGGSVIGKHYRNCFKSNKNVNNLLSLPWLQIAPSSHWIYMLECIHLSVTRYLDPRVFFVFTIITYDTISKFSN